MRLCVAALLGGTILLEACSTAPSDPGVEDNAEAITAAPSLTNADAIARATEWSDAKLQYCWTPNGGNNHAAGDYACAEICKREANPEWDPYRSDCSGLVSWAWNLPAPGRTTLGFYPFQKDITVGIQATELRAGDAINNEEHVMLFKEWVTAGKRAVFIEEPGCSSSTPYAHEVTSDVTISGMTITPAVEGRSFTAIRYTKLAVATPAKTDDGGAAPIEPAESDDDGGAASTSTTEKTRKGAGDDGQPAESESVTLPTEASEAGCALGHSSATNNATGASFAWLALGLVLAARRRRASAS